MKQIKKHYINHNKKNINSYITYIYEMDNIRGIYNLKWENKIVKDCTNNKRIVHTKKQISTIKATM